MSDWRHCHLDSVDSTNRIAMDFARDGDPGQIWITADEQTEGKARRGRKWVSKKGNLYASLLLINPAPADQLATLPLVVSLALHQALVSLVAETLPEAVTEISIKWPNDILIDGKKVSGILLEALHGPNDRLAVIIGCGVNCQHFPDNSLYPATSLLEQGFNIAPVDLLTVLAGALESELAVWDRGAGFNATRQSWLDKASGLNAPIVARMNDREHMGQFETIDDQGLLVLKQDDGSIRRISSADIFFGNLANSKA